MTISSVDLPEPEGPTQADCLAAPYMQVDVLEDMDPRRAAPERQIDPGERDCGPAPTGLAGAKELSCMPSSRRSSVATPPGGQGAAPRSYGSFAAWSRRWSWSWQLPLLCSSLRQSRRRRRERPVKIVALGDSLTAGFGLPANRGLSGRSSKRRSRPRASRSRSPMPGCPATPRRAAWPGSTGRCRTGTDARHRRTRRQRHAARASIPR